MLWFVSKSGMPMYDLEKAYGLGLIVKQLTDEEVKVYDKGPYYQIETPATFLKEEKNNLEKILSLAAPNLDAWDRVLRTTLRKNRPRKIEKVQQILKNSCKEILHSFKEPFPHEALSKKSKELLTGPLELSAFKGFREPIRGQKYDEGSAFTVPEEDWALCMIGALHFTIWRFIALTEESAVLIPNPDSEKGIEVNHWREMKFYLENEGGLSRVSTSCWVAHSAVRLYQELWHRKYSDNPWEDRFSKFIYGSLTGAAQQSKPKTGGYFSLGFFENLLNNEQGAEVLTLFDRIFQAGNRKGSEDIAIRFSEFLNIPSLENYTKFLGVFSRSLMRREIYAKVLDEVWRGKLEENTWKEVIRYVRS